MKVSVVTATWQRHDVLLNRCIPSIANQTMNCEHVVASDGPDPELQELLQGLDVVYVEVDQHHEDPINVGGRARNRGLEFVSGDLVAYLDDDNSFRPNHVRLLAKALAVNPHADFAYSQMFRHGIGDVVGADPPQYGMIDSSIIMSRADTHTKFGGWPVPSSYAIDWELIDSWVKAGATWVFVPEVTVDYYYTPRP